MNNSKGNPSNETRFEDDESYAVNIRSLEDPSLMHFDGFALTKVLKTYRDILIPISAAELKELVEFEGTKEYGQFESHLSYLVANGDIEAKIENNAPIREAADLFFGENPRYFRSVQEKNTFESLVGKLEFIKELNSDLANMKLDEETLIYIFEDANQEFGLDYTKLQFDNYTLVSNVFEINQSVKNGIGFNMDFLKSYFGDSDYVITIRDYRNFMRARRQFFIDDIKKQKFLSSL